jgi:maltose O-acetyltransferase
MSSIMTNTVHPAEGKRTGEIRAFGTSAGLKLFGIRALNYLTNYVVNHIPSYTLRHLWYRRVLGVQLGEGSGILLGCYIWFHGPGQMRRNGLRIGENTRINRNCCLDARGSLTIGNYVNISPEVMILSGDHDYNDPAFAARQKPVVIEDYAYIGARAMIVAGVTVGRGAVVAAGSMVGTNVAPGTVVMGVPARPVGRRDVDPQYPFVPLPLFE